MSQNEKIFQQFQLPKGWRWAKLGEMCKVFSGSAAPQDKKYFENGKYPFVRVQDLGKFGRTCNLANTRDHVNDLAIKELNMIKAEKGTILFPKSGAAITTNNRAILGIDAFIVSHLAALKPFSEVADTFFVYYWLCLIDLVQFMENLGYPSLKLSTISKISIPRPSFPEQCRIAAKIQELMQEIEHARAACEKQLEAAQTLPAAYLREVFESEEAKNWEKKKLGEVCIINPSRPKNFTRSPDVPTTFIPMAAVDGRTGTVAKSEVVPYLKVSKGYTYFEENDVLFAKITPCMQNGKHVIVRNLIDGIGFGTTEFHVLRPGKEILPEWIWYFVRRACFLHEATTYFSGAVGQQRVPENFLANSSIPCPPLSMQKYLVAELDEKTARLEKIYMAAKKQLDIINVFPQKILKRAFKGEL